MPEPNAKNLTRSLIAETVGIRSDIVRYLGHAETDAEKELVLVDPSDRNTAVDEPQTSLSIHEIAQTSRQRSISLQEIRRRFLPLLARIEDFFSALSETAPGSLRQLRNLPLISDPANTSWHEALLQLHVVVELLNQASVACEATSASSHLASREEPAGPRHRTIPHTVLMVKELRGEGLTHQGICERLDHAHVPRPPAVHWKHLRWAEAYRQHIYRDAVKTWLSKAIGMEISGKPK